MRICVFLMIFGAVVAAVVGRVVGSVTGPIVTRVSWLMLRALKVADFEKLRTPDSAYILCFGIFLS